MKTGVELIREEREEQINKHNRTVAWDMAINKDYELSEAASILCKSDWICNEPEDMIEHMPENWDKDLCKKMLGKTYEERLIIAGALIAAELDRIRECE